MNFADEIRKLRELHFNGALTDEEFTRAKNKLLSDSGVDPASPAIRDLLAEVQRDSALARLERDWQQQQAQYMITGKHGQRYLPNKTTSVIMGFAVTMFGILWTVFAASITSHAPSEMGAVRLFPLFGLIFIFVGIAVSIYSFNMATAYEKALQQYQQKRQQLLDSEAENNRTK